MNNIFKVIWSHTQQAFVVVSELTKSHGKAKSQQVTTSATSSKANPLLKLSLISAAVLGSQNAVAANNITEANWNIYSSVLTNYPADIATNRNNVILGYNANPQSGDGTGGGGGGTIQFMTIIGSHAGGVEGSTVMGYAANSTGFMGTAIGREATTRKQLDTAVGYLATAQGQGSSALGSRASALGFNSVAVGNTTSALVTNAVAVGSDSVARGAYSTALGPSAQANGTSSFAVNYGSQAIGHGSLSIGRFSKSDGRNAIAVGGGAYALGERSIAIGVNKNANDGDAPQGATTNGLDSIAIGTDAKTTVDNAIAIGKDANASNVNAVALGTGSTTSAPVACTSATVNGVSYSGFAGTNPNSTVSVGSDTIKRTITNVAAGRIDSGSTDAINGSQLYMVANKLAEGWAIGNTSKTKVGDVKTNKQVNFIGEGGTTVTVEPDSVTGNYNVRINSTATAAATDTSTYFHVNNGSATGGNAATNLGNITEAAGATGTNSLAAGVNAKANQTRSTAVGFNSKAQAQDATAIGSGAEGNAQESFAAGYNAMANGSQSISLGHWSSTGTARATDTDSSGAYSIAIGSHAVVTGDNSGYIGRRSNAHTSSGVSGNDSYVLGNYNNVSANNTFVLGNNVSVAAGVDGAVILGAGSSTSGSHTVANVTAATVNGLTYGGFAGNVTNSSQFVSVGSNAANGQRKLINVAAGNISSTSTEAINGSQLYMVANKLSEGWAIGNTTKAKVGDVKTNKQVNFIGEGGTTVTVEEDTTGSGNYNVKINSTSPTLGSTTYGADRTDVNPAISIGAGTNGRVNITTTGAWTTSNERFSGDNIETFVGANNEILIGIKENPTFKSVKIGDGSNTTNLTSTANGLDVEGDKVTNISNAAITSTSKDAVAGNQLHTVSNSVATTLGGGANVNTTTGAVQNFSQPLNTTGATSYTAPTTAAATVADAITNLNNYVNAGWVVGNNAGTQVARISPNEQVNFVNGKGTTANVTSSGTGANVTFDVNTSAATSTNANGSIAAPTTADGANFVNATTLVNTVNNASWNVSASNVTGTTGKSTYTANADSKINAGDTVNYKAGNNIELGGSGNNLTIATSMTPTFNTVNATDKITIGNGTNTTNLTSTANGLDVGGDRITNMGDAVNGNDAVTLNQLNATTVKVTSDDKSVAVTKTGGTNGQPTVYDLSVNTVFEYVNEAGDTVVIGKDGNYYKADDLANATYNPETGKYTKADGSVVNPLSDEEKSKVVIQPKAGDEHKLTNIANGNVADGSSDVVTGDQLYNYVNVNGKPATKSDGTVNFVDGNGTTVSINSDGNIAYNVLNTTLSVNPLGSANQGSLVQPTTNANHFVTAGDLYTTLSTMGWNVNTAADGGTAKGSAKTLVKAGDTVKFIAGDNIQIDQNGQDIKISTTAGAKGENGKSAYDIWKEQPGNDGKSVEDFLESLKGTKGDPGTAGTPGADGKDGKDGKSVVAEVQPDGSVKVSEVDPETKEKTEIATITNGQDGAPGADGKDGKSVVAEVQPDGSVKVSEVDPETKEKTEIATITNGQDGAPGKDGAPGADGKDGKSVVAEVQPDGSVKVSEVDPETKEKTEIATITNGTDGKDGKSVVAEVQPDGSVKVSEVDPETKEKTEIATITNGQDGAPGKDGAPG
ncbi:hypothetical protein BMT54_07880, partial [Pasteurellaceae bacterium 15-036681]